MVVEIPDFRKGKKTRKGEPLPTKEELVTAVTKDDVDKFLGTRSLQERIAHLRGLRQMGVLIHNKNRLTQRVRTESGRRRDCYVFRGPWWAVPRADGQR